MKRRTPVTEAGLRKFDSLPPEVAALKAWTDAGVAPQWHEASKRELRDLMPLLARALDRMEKGQ